ncbi:hypothetical protein LSTR_LSTR004046 [Laodelphax striatellus]|uniref:Proteasome inhibitor PI31 subunit n=1 Tax=Laodelphax striatellus TaxID=195883 RepID=A0A482WFB7_LAOST|nr:hypothetical protein LSTR_LSTR004046 [Laodelphax striatellus]
MASRQDSIIGWNLLYNTLEKNIKCKQDVLIGLIHLILVNRKYRLLDTSSKNLRSTEMLPSTWNKDSSFFVFTYINTINQIVYELQAITPCNDVLVVNILDKSAVDVRTVYFKLSEYVKNLEGALVDLIPEYKEVVKTIESNLLVNNAVTKHTITYDM